MYNSSLSVELISKDVSDVDFYISDIKAPLGLIELKLNFDDPSKISASVEPDKIKVTVNEDIVYSNDEYETRLFRLVSSTKELPPQISEGMQGLASTFKDGQLQVSGSTVVNFGFSVFV